MDCVGFFNNAHKQLEQFSDDLQESDVRSIVHMAYYYVYHLCIEKLGEKASGRDSLKHSDVESRLRSYKGLDPVIQDAKRYFTSLKVLRVLADYKLEDQLTADDAEDAVEWAQKLRITALKELKNAS